MTNSQTARRSGVGEPLLCLVFIAVAALFLFFGPGRGWMESIAATTWIGHAMTPAESDAAIGLPGDAVLLAFDPLTSSRIYVEPGRTSAEFACAYTERFLVTSLDNAGGKVTAWSRAKTSLPVCFPLPAGVAVTRANAASLRELLPATATH